jgi:hypothetical protein
MIVQVKYLAVYNIVVLPLYSQKKEMALMRLGLVNIIVGILKTGQNYSKIYKRLNGT